jgi:predicted nucleic-acid-binding protein
MVSIDTNIVVRLLVNDDPLQTARAGALFKANKIFIAKTVVLESEWVLRAVYGLDRKKVNAAILALISLEDVVVEDDAVLFTALEAHSNGLDFADALHVSSSRRADKFATFDTALRARAIKQDIQPLVVLP